jgi:hypothetical protein
MGRGIGKETDEKGRDVVPLCYSASVPAFYKPTVVNLNPWDSIVWFKTEPHVR